MNIKPLGDRLVIKRFTADDKTTGGIILPEGAKEKPQKGKVLAVGPGKLSKEGKRTPLSVKEGDTVLFTNWAGDEFKRARAMTFSSCAKRMCWPLLMLEKDGTYRTHGTYMTHKSHESYRSHVSYIFRGKKDAC